MTTATDVEQAGSLRMRLWWAVVWAAAVIVVLPAGVWAADAFTDVADGNVHHDAVAALRDAGVSQGCAEGRYCPDAAVRRDQMASFMDRLGALSGQAPVVNAATAEQAADSAALGGTAAQVLLDRLEALETQLADATARTGTLETDLTAATARIGTLEADNADLQARVDTLETDNADLQATLAGVARSQDSAGRDTLTFTGMNVQVVNGTGSTDEEPNGLGNLIIGYNAPRPATDPAVDRAGSHYLVVGDEHHWTRFGGILAGLRNAATGDWASVTGGRNNTASGLGASVTGGAANSASGDQASVTGGNNNTASGTSTSVSGGAANSASGSVASVSGGANNAAGGDAASVSGGAGNTASGDRASVAGGRGGLVGGNFDSRIGNTDFPDS